MKNWKYYIPFLGNYYVIRDLGKGKLNPYTFGYWSMLAVQTGLELIILWNLFEWINGK